MRNPSPERPKGLQLKGDPPGRSTVCPGQAGVHWGVRGGRSWPRDELSYVTSLCRFQDPSACAAPGRENQPPSHNRPSFNLGISKVSCLGHWEGTSAAQWGGAPWRHSGNQRGTAAVSGGGVLRTSINERPLPCGLPGTPGGVGAGTSRELKLVSEPRKLGFF